MRVALINQPWAHTSPPSESIAIYNHELARRLADTGDAPVVYGAGPAQAVGVRWRGVEQRFIPTTADWRLRRLTGPFERLAPARRPLFASRLYFPAYFSRVAADLRQRGCDAVHVHNFLQAAPVLRRALPDAVIVLHMHCDWLSQLAPRLVERRLRNVDVVLGAGRFVTGRARAAMPAASASFVPVCNGADLDRFRPGVPAAATPPRLLAVGRISPEKGIHVLLDAVEQLLAVSGDVELVLVGAEAPVPPEMLVRLSDDPRVRALRRYYDGSYLDELLRRASPRVRAAVRQAGYVEHDALASHYSHATLLVNSSLSEALPMPVIEGMASGLPVVATRVGGTPELVEDGLTGFLVEPGDAGGLADRLGQLLEDEELRVRMGAAARRRAVEGFGWDEAARQARAAYVAAGAAR